MAATSMNGERQVMVLAAREMVTRPSSNCWRSVWSTLRLNSGKFIEEQHSMLRHRDLAGRRIDIPAEQTRASDTG